MTQEPGGATSGQGPAADRSVPGALEGIDDLPVAEHVARFAVVHDELRARLDAPEAAVAPGETGAEG